MADPITTALDQLAAYGLVVDHFIADGKLRRVKSTDDKGSKKSGWYVAHEFRLSSGRVVISGSFGNWKISNQPESFKFDASFTDEEKQAFKKQQAAQRKAAEKEKRERNKQAASRADKIWPNLPAEGHSPYLERKQIHGFGVRYGKNKSIAVPVYQSVKNESADGLTGSFSDRLAGLQWIFADGGKKFLTGTEIDGGYFKIEGDINKPMILCEGYATGASLRMATGSTVIVCFNSGNLVKVADMVASRFIGVTSVMVAADNDVDTADRRPDIGNPGLKAASSVAAKYPHWVIHYPPFVVGSDRSDFNDIHVLGGLAAINGILDGPAQLLSVEEEKTKNGQHTPIEPSAVGDPPDVNWRALLKRKSDQVMNLSSNVELILKNDSLWDGALAYCDFSYRIIKRRAPIPDMLPGEWEDADTARLAIWLSNTYGFEPPRNKLTDGIIVAAQRCRFHPVRDYLNSLTWDGTERIDNWLEDIYEANTSEVEPTEPNHHEKEKHISYLSAVGSKFLIGAVARVMRPGCKMDNVMILEGKQGLKKSTSLATLFGEWFSDAPIPIGDKDAYQNIQGVWCSELAELDSFNKAESTSAKQFFSQVRDRYRPSYGQHAQDFLRQTTFVGTTNQGEYLKDYTGNRRYWPIKCNIVHLESLKHNRDQLWAEAYQRYKDGDSWWPDDATRSVFEAEQDHRMQIDPWHYRIEDYLNKSTAKWFRSDDILTEVIGKDLGAIQKADQTRLSPIMKKLGYINKKKRIPVDGQMLPRNVYIYIGEEA